MMKILRCENNPGFGFDVEFKAEPGKTNYPATAGFCVVSNPFISDQPIKVFVKGLWCAPSQKGTGLVHVFRAGFEVATGYAFHVEVEFERVDDFVGEDVDGEGDGKG